MATNATPKTVYPLSNKQGVAIPFDVARPVRGVMDDLAVDAELILAALAGSITVIHVTCDQYAELQVREGATVLSNFFLVPDVLYDLAITADNATDIVLVNKGTLSAKGIINEVVRWTQLDNQNFGVS